MAMLQYIYTNKLGAIWRIALLTIIWLSLVKQAYGQNSFKLQHRYKADKTKIISISDATSIKTKDRKHALSFARLTDSSVLLMKYRKTGRDTVYPDPVWGNVRDYSFKQPVYETDTTEVMLADIMWIKAPRFKNTRWVEGFVWLGLVMVPTAIGVPIAELTSSNRDPVSEWIGIEAAIIGVTILPILIGTSNIKYDLTKKWKLQVD